MRQTSEGLLRPWRAVVLAWCGAFGSLLLSEAAWAQVAVEPIASWAPVAEPGEATSYELLLRRLEQTEQRLQWLESQQPPAVDPAAFDTYATDFQPGGGSAPAPPKEKKWYDHISIRGYGQFRYNYVTHTAPDSATPNHAGDSSIGPDQEFLIRRARVIFTGNVSDHLRVYLQPDFASTPDGSVANIQFAQIRDWYGDVFLDKDQVHRLRIGQSKIPYGWENLQSSQNRLFLDRNDAFNSAARNERDLGAFYYWTPQYATDLFKILVDENLKGSGNYGVFGIGVYNGQGGSLRELNDNLHFISRFTLPWVTDSGQVYEVGMQGYTGYYVVRGSPIQRRGVGPALTPTGTLTTGGEEGLLDQRLGWTFVRYPQPLGFQAEWTIGRGPALNEAQSAVERRSLHGGYAATYYKLDTHCWGTLFPFARWQYFEGGYKSFNNAPYSFVDEWNLGVEWQIRKEMELVTEYVITDRTNLTALAAGESYRQFVGDVFRLQFQVNY